MFRMSARPDVVQEPRIFWTRTIVRLVLEVWDDWGDRDSKGILEIYNCPLKGIGVRIYREYIRNI